MGSLDKKFKIGIVAGEQSGDQLGASLIQKIKEIEPSVEFVGVGGPLMTKEGLNSFFDMEKISVMGIVEPLKNLKEILSLRKGLKEYLINQQIDLFIGIDSPDFNLSISKYLKKRSIKSIQYVGPSIWAWRQGRIKTIEKSVDEVLTLFPFESNAYKGSSVHVTFVGHPLAHLINVQDMIDKRSNKKIVLMPGSRKSEILAHGMIFLETAKKIKKYDQEFSFHMPLVDESHINLIEGLKKEDWIEISIGNAKEVLKDSSMGFVTSGTASLEAALYGTPVVVAYKTNWLSYKVIKPLLRIKNISLPNILSEKELLPEFLQDDVNPESLLEGFKNIQNNYLNCLKDFERIHTSLLSDGPNTAAARVLEIIDS